MQPVVATKVGQCYPLGIDVVQIGNHRLPFLRPLSLCYLDNNTRHGVSDVCLLCQNVQHPLKTTPQHSTIIHWKTSRITHTQIRDERMYMVASTDADSPQAVSCACEYVGMQTYVKLRMQTYLINVVNCTDVMTLTVCCNFRISSNNFKMVQ